MHAAVKRGLAAALLSTVVAFAQQPQTVREIERMITQYAHSIDLADPSLAAKIWSQSTGVSFIHPRGHEHSFDEIVKHVYEQLMGGMFSERKLEVKDVHVHPLGDAAWAEFDWDFTAKLKTDGSTVKTQGRETQIYRKEPAGWRLVHVHYSGMPVSAPGQ